MSDDDVKGIVEMHGGSVAAVSAGAGRGSTFTVRLPLAERAVEPREVGASGPRATSPSGRRVLVVDDNEDGAEALTMMLTVLGHEVHTARDGIEAVETAERVRPQLVLMDIGLPRLNGLDATRQIRAQPWGDGISIAALTGWGQNRDRARSREAGCDSHLVKPVSLPELERLLADLPRNRTPEAGAATR